MRFSFTSFVPALVIVPMACSATKEAEAPAAEFPWDGDAAVTLAAEGAAEQAGSQQGGSEQGEGTRPVKDGVLATRSFTVSIPRSLRVPYAGAFASSFPEGLPFAPGSGLRLVSRGPSKLTFVGVTDRGPNGDAPKVASARPGQEADKPQSAKVFPAPSYTPTLATFEVTPQGGARVVGTVPLHVDGRAISGRPITPGATGSTKETPLDDRLAPLAYDDTGLDPEGVDLAPNGEAWLCDEYGPFLVRVEAATGRILERLAPGAGLPDILAARQPNRGFEGVAVTPEGVVFAIVQSTLDVDGKTKNVARFVRLLRYDPRTGATQMFAYPIDDVYAKPSDAKIGDLLALDETHLALLEQGDARGGVPRNVVYVLDVAGATDLTGRVLTAGANAGKDLEYGAPEELTGITLVRKARVFDLRDHGWTAEKSEGLALVDRRTLAIINDNDFGLRARMRGGPSSDPGDYVVAADGSLTVDGQATTATYALTPLAPEDAATRLVFFRLRKPLLDYAP